MSSKMTRFLLLPTRFCLCLLSLLYWVLVYGTALITASMVLTRIAWRGLKNPRKTFQWTVRKSPPACLRDPELGRHGFVRARSSGLRLHYVEKGDHKNPLMLFLHGFPENWYSWRYQLCKFSAQYHTVAFDLRGCGDSAAPCRPEEYALEKLLDDIRDTISGLGHTSCVLVGHDWGGMLAWYFALERPDMVQRLIIMNAPHPAAWLGNTIASLGWCQRQKRTPWFSLAWLSPFAVYREFVGNVRWLCRVVALRCWCLSQWQPPNPVIEHGIGNSQDKKGGLQSLGSL